MTSKDKMQASILLRKYSLDEIERKLSHSLKAVPSLLEEDKLYTEKLLEAVAENRTAATELQLITFENGHQIAKRVQKQREIDDINKTLKELIEQCSKIEQLTEQEKIAENQHMSEYEAKMTEITNKCLKYVNIYNEEMTKSETIKAKTILRDQLAVENMYQDEIVELKQALDNMNQDVPDNILVIVGRRELEKKLNSLTQKYSHLKKY